MDDEKMESVIEDIICTLEEIAMRACHELGGEAAQNIIDRMEKTREKLKEVKE